MPDLNWEKSVEDADRARVFDMSLVADEVMLRGEVLRRVVEPRRRSIRMSLREAARRAGMSEANWRQLVAGGLSQNGTHIARMARRDQVLSMALAVGALDDAADVLHATEPELREARDRVVVPDPAEKEILGARFLSADEKLHLLSRLREFREGGDG